MKNSFVYYDEEMIKKMIISDLKRVLKVEVKSEDIKRTEFGNWEVKTK